MPRVRRSWGTILPIIEGQLKDEVGAASFWSPTLLLNVWNEHMDLRSMDLGLAHEGHRVQRWKTTIGTEGADTLSLPVDAHRLTKVSYYDPGAEVAYPLDRRERFSEPESQSDRSGLRVLPSYRVLARHLLFNPPFADAAAEVWLEFEAAVDLFTDETSKIPEGWPLETEHMLMLDVLCGAFDTEEAQSAELTIPSGFKLRHRRYEARWLDTIETRSFGRTFGTRHQLGG